MPISFSVIVPLYNKQAYIERALNSVYAQTHAPKELIIVNDVCTDDSILVAQNSLARLKQRRPEIHVTILHNKENKGPGAARNYGLQIATSEYVLFLDADDEYQPRLLEKIQRLVKDERADMIIFGYRRLPDNLVLPSPTITAPGWLTPHDHETYRLNDPLSIVYDRRYPLGPGSNVAIKRTATHGLRYDETAKVYEGIDFWFRVMQKIVNVDGNVFYLVGEYHVVHSVPESLIRKKLAITEIEYPRVLKRYAFSDDRYEKALRTRVAKMWFGNSYSRLNKVIDKLLFIWRCRNLAKTIIQSNQFPGSQ